MEKWKTEIVQFIESILDLERKAWINGERCSMCGVEMEQSATSNVCEKCYDEE